METSSENPLVAKKRVHSRSRSKSPESSEERSIKKIRIDNTSSDEFILKEITVNIEKLTNKQISLTENEPKTDDNEVCSISDDQDCKENSEIPSECAVTETGESHTRSTQSTFQSTSQEPNLLESTKNQQMELDSSTQENDKNTSELNMSSKESSGENDELNESMEISNTNKESSTPLQTPNKKLKSDSSKKLTPKQVEKKLEAEKRKQERQKFHEERMKKKLEEKERALQEKMKKQEMKQKEIELRKKEKEEKEEAKRKEKEEREQKRKEKEEKEKQKRKEREEEKLKKQQEIEEKNKEKLKEEEKKQKAAAAFVNFFVAKKVDESQDETKIQASNFLQFEVKSDMKLPPTRRESLSSEQKRRLDELIQHQNAQASYLKDLSSGKPVGRSSRTWPFEEPTDDVVLVDLGETICEDKSSLQRYRSKFLHFHENRRPAYYGTWRKKSRVIKPRKPFAEDDQFLNYEEDSDDDWEEEEQGESLNGSEDEAEKENEDEKDDYEVDNEFFVPHGHLSDDEVDDEETARLSPESLKQKLKLLKEEFDEDMQSKTQKLKPRSIGCIWYSKDDGNVDDPIDRCLQPFAMITRHTQIIIKSRTEIANSKKDKKVNKELDGELMASFLKIIHGSCKKKVDMVEQFLTQNTVAASKNSLCNLIKQSAVYEKYKDEQTKKHKFRWVVNKEFRDKYNF
ncbi:unnamed protein product [Phyllotreta striolata]|uniref:Chromatin assembly factor 1 subunit A n=1 Tax=Phyllotreta striolata TaxID=444603 RepID=A0A9N9TAL2_PHYSR|nr:unnamed protein product [Phyllotreta striolata]